MSAEPSKLRKPTPPAARAGPAMPVRNTASCVIIAMIDSGVAPSALRTPISLVRSLTAIIMMFDTPTTPAASVPRPMITTKNEMIQNSFENRSNCSTLSWTRAACGSSGENWWRSASWPTISLGDRLGLGGGRRRRP